MSSTHIDNTINSPIKRPQNSFMKFAQKNRHVYSKKNPDMTNSAISTLLGQEWAKLSLNDRQYYIDLAAEEKIKHQEKYPGYRYTPNINKMKKRNRKIFKKRGRKCKILAHKKQTIEMPLMGYFENVNFQKCSSHKSFNTFSHSNYSTDTEEEDDFDRLQNYYKTISFESVNYDVFDVLQESFDEYILFPTVYISCDPFEECLDSDDCLHPINYDI